MLRQISRYGVVGFFLNSIGYFLYVIVVSLGIDSKIAMSVVYFIGFFIGFYGNRKFTFDDRGHVAATGIKYTVVYAVGYLINLGFIFLLVDSWGYEPGKVQFFAIGVVAIINFLLLKYYAFAKNADFDCA